MTLNIKKWNRDKMIKTYPTSNVLFIYLFILWDKFFSPSKVKEKK